MSGKKGRSGRGTTRSDVIRNQVIIKSWQLAHEFLNDISVALKDKMDFVSRITTKDMPTHLTGEAIVNETKIIIVRDSPKAVEQLKEEVNVGRTLSFNGKTK